jgi:hypothetical protein
MSRVGSFPLHTAYSALQSFAHGAAKVFDPFCGKGTSLLAARLLGSEAYGLDTGPEAVICSKAKLTSITVADADDYLQRIRLVETAVSGVPAAVKIFFHPTTLSQIISLNEALQESIATAKKKEREIAITLQATLLGILHGHSSYSLSISSAHAYAMAPNYVARYAAEHKLEPPLRNVKQCLLMKLRRCLSRSLPPRVRCRVIMGRAQDAAKIFPNLRNQVDCVLTSPPYLASHTYAKDNWLRQWLLGFDYRELNKDYLQTGSITRYRAQMQVVLDNIAQLLRPQGRLICIIGHGRRTNARANEQSVSLQRMFVEMLGETSPAFDLEFRRTEYVAGPRRYLHALKTTNGHHDEVRREYILVATKKGCR